EFRRVLFRSRVRGVHDHHHISAPRRQVRSGRAAPLRCAHEHRSLAFFPSRFAPPTDAAGVPMIRRMRIGTIIKRILLVIAAVQGATLIALRIVDVWRKRKRSPAVFPRLPPLSVTVGGSEVTVYTYGEDLYA